MSPITAKKKADILGHLKAQAAEIKQKIDQIKQELVDAGIDEIEGKLFRVTLTKETKSNVNWTKIQEKYDIPVKKFTTFSESIRMNVVSRVS